MQCSDLTRIALFIFAPPVPIRRPAMPWMRCVRSGSGGGSSSQGRGSTRGERCCSPGCSQGIPWMVHQLRIRLEAIRKSQREECMVSLCLVSF